jgi:hypothetical protein
MSDGISANICHDTATAAIWDVIAAMVDDLRADLDQLLAQAGQRPRLRRFGHRSIRMKMALVAGEGVELKTHVGGEGATRQACPFDRPFPLLRRAALILEGDDALRRSRQVGDDEADTRERLIRVPVGVPETRFGGEGPEVALSCRSALSADRSPTGGKADLSELWSTYSFISTCPRSKSRRGCQAAGRRVSNRVFLANHHVVPATTHVPNATAISVIM